jgi:hypothetical protein
MSGERPDLSEMREEALAIGFRDRAATAMLGERARHATLASRRSRTPHGMPRRTGDRDEGGDTRLRYRHQPRRPRARRPRPRRSPARTSACRRCRSRPDGETAARARSVASGRRRPGGTPPGCSTTEPGRVEAAALVLQAAAARTQVVPPRSHRANVAAVGGRSRSGHRRQSGLLRARIGRQGGAPRPVTRTPVGAR